MAKRYPISLALSAFEDLQGIRNWYASQQVPEVGERLVGEIVAQLDTLATFPESGRQVPELDVPQLRELIHPPFRLVYRFDREAVRIVRIWRSERLMNEDGITQPAHQHRQRDV